MSCYGKKFRDPITVKDHYKYVHENMRFACEVYERQFRNQTNLKRRNKTFHETSSEEVPPCAECGKRWLLNCTLTSMREGTKN